MGIRSQILISRRQISKRVSEIKSQHPKGQVMAVIKAKAYGLGAVEMAQLLDTENVAFLALATVDEARCLKAAGIQTPLFLLNEPFEMAASDLDPTFTYTVYTPEIIDRLASIGSPEAPVAVHLKIDTGMHRLGCPLSDVDARIAQIDALPSLRLTGLLSHLADSEQPQSEHVAQQIKDFNSVVDPLRQTRPDLVVHMANTGAYHHYPQSYFDLLRIGVGLYDQALTLESKIAYLRDVQAGSPVGYSCNYVPRHDTKIAVVAMGYADGLPTVLGNTGHCLIHGQRFPIVGNVCMDMVFVDVGDSSGIQAADTVTFLGENGGNIISLDDLVAAIPVNPREFLCGLGPRVLRVFT